jgi:AcrR family transcriptional regulator
MPVAPTTARRHILGVSHEARQEERRARLLAAGLEAFGKQGFHSVSVKEVCGLAKLTERYFYESFESREALFVAVYEEATERIRHAIAEAHAEIRPDAMAFARAGLEVALRMYRDDPRVARVVLLEPLAVAASGKAQLAVTQAFSEEIGAIAQAFYPQLRERRLNAETIGAGLYGSTVGIVIRWALNHFREPIEVVLEHCLLFYDAIDQRMKSARSVGAGAKPTKRAPRRRRQA